MVLLFTAPIYIALTFVGWGVFTITNSIIKKHGLKFRIEVLLIVFLYAFYALGLLWSENKDYAKFDLEVKMSLAIFPFLFAYANYGSQQLKIILYSFLFGAVVGLSILYAEALYDMAFNGKGFGRLFYTELTSRIHPSYYSFYMNIGILMLLLDYNYKKLNLFKKNWVYMVLILFFAVSSVLLLSKMGVLTTILLLFFLPYYWVKSGKWYVSITVVALAIGASYMSYQKSAKVKARVDEMFQGMGSSPTGYYQYSTAIRFSIWKCSYDLIQIEPIKGYGPGDVRQALLVHYRIYKIKRAELLQLNAHNQFLQTTLALGILAGLMLIAIILIPLFRYRSNYGYGAFFSLICLLFFLSESVLETQAGVLGFIIFYTLFNSLKITLENETAHTDPVLSA